VRRRLAEAAKRARVLQLGGAAGSLSSLGDQGLEVAATVARELDLDLPDLPWHAHRDRLGDLAGALGLVAGVLGKLGRDLSLLMQNEVAEVREPQERGKGASSTMPQKQNPVACGIALAAAARVPGLVATLLAAMPQEHERGLGGWHAEWETIPEIFGLVAGAARAMAKTCESLEIDVARMRKNLDETRGLVMAEAVMLALAKRIGRREAQGSIDAAVHCARVTGQSFAEVLRSDSKITQSIGRDDLDRLLEPERYLGEAVAFVARVLVTRTKP
jgi:3-carboxy-cis,cis-muconate cycloisomerase